MYVRDQEQHHAIQEIDHVKGILEKCFTFGTDELINVKRGAKVAYCPVDTRKKNIIWSRILLEFLLKKHHLEPDPGSGFPSRATKACFLIEFF